MMDRVPPAQATAVPTRAPAVTPVFAAVPPCANWFYMTEERVVAPHLVACTISRPRERACWRIVPAVTAAPLRSLTAIRTTSTQRSDQLDVNCPVDRGISLPARAHTAATDSMSQAIGRLFIASPMARTTMDCMARCARCDWTVVACMVRKADHLVENYPAVPGSSASACAHITPITIPADARRSPCAWTAAWRYAEACPSLIQTAESRLFQIKGAHPPASASLLATISCQPRLCVRSSWRRWK